VGGEGRRGHDKLAHPDGARPLFLRDASFSSYWFGNEKGGKEGEEEEVEEEGLNVGEWGKKSVTNKLGVSTIKRVLRRKGEERGKKLKKEEVQNRSKRPSKTSNKGRKKGPWEEKSFIKHRNPYEKRAFGDRTKKWGGSKGLIQRKTRKRMECRVFRVERSLSKRKCEGKSPRLQGPRPAPSKRKGNKKCDCTTTKTWDPGLQSDS